LKRLLALFVVCLALFLAAGWPSVLQQAGYVSFYRDYSQCFNEYNQQGAPFNCQSTGIGSPELKESAARTRFRTISLQKQTPVLWRGNE